jgi:hypothetical protein
MANNPQIPNYKPGVGRLVTDRYDFENHVEGNAFRHNALAIDMANPSAAPGGATTVEGALDFVQTFIEAQAGVGEGFITVGDGYDTWHAADGNVNFDPTIPSLDTLLNSIFSQIIAYQSSYTPVSSSLERIKDGGIVVIKSGTYIIANPVSVPPGITILGEGYGTKIVNATSLNLSVTPPVLQTPYAVTASANVSGAVQLTVNPAIPGLVTGDYINISNASNPGNGTWTVTFISSTTGSTTFTLNNSTGSTFGNFTTSTLVTTTAPMFDK